MCNCLQCKKNWATILKECPTFCSPCKKAMSEEEKYFDSLGDEDEQKRKAS